MENQFELYVYRYPRYFIFNEVELPDDDDATWDDESGRLILEDGTDFYYTDEDHILYPTGAEWVVVGNDYFENPSDYLIPWPCDVEAMGRNMDAYFYHKYPLAILNEHDEYNAVFKYLLFIDNQEFRKAGRTIENLLDYQLDNQAEPIQFLDYLITGLNAHPLKSIVWLRVKNKIVEWHDGKIKELNSLLGAPAILEQPIVEEEEIELTPLEIKAIARKVVLFHELGVIDPLKIFCKSKNPTLSDTKFADLVGSMMGFKGKQLGTVRKALSGYGQGGKSDVRSRAALDKVKGELMKLGITL